MFNCDFCHRTIGPKIRPSCIVTKTRGKRYKNGTNGWEIVQEKKACPDCIDSIRAAQANGKRRR